MAAQFKRVGLLRVDADSSDLARDAQPHVELHECLMCFALVRDGRQDLHEQEMHSPHGVRVQ